MPGAGTGADMLGTIQPALWWEASEPGGAGSTTVTSTPLLRR